MPSLRPITTISRDDGNENDHAATSNNTEGGSNHIIEDQPNINIQQNNNHSPEQQHHHHQQWGQQQCQHYYSNYIDLRKTVDRMAQQAIMNGQYSSQSQALSTSFLNTMSQNRNLPYQKSFTIRAGKDGMSFVRGARPQAQIIPCNVEGCDEPCLAGGKVCSKHVAVSRRRQLVGESNDGICMPTTVKKIHDNKKSCTMKKVDEKNKCADDGPTNESERRCEGGRKQHDIKEEAVEFSAKKRKLVHHNEKQDETQHVKAIQRAKEVVQAYGERTHAERCKGGGDCKDEAVENIAKKRKLVHHSEKQNETHHIKADRQAKEVVVASVEQQGSEVHDGETASKIDAFLCSRKCIDTTCLVDECSQKGVPNCGGYCSECYRSQKLVAKQIDKVVKDAFAVEEKKWAVNQEEQSGQDTKSNKEENYDGEEKWKDNFISLAIHYNEMGANAPVKEKENKKLRGWVKNQRNAFRNGVLSDTKIEQLSSIGFIFTPSTPQDGEEWFRHMDRLSQYVLEHRKLPAPYTKYKKLRCWAVSQSMKLKQGQLSGDKASRFKKIIEMAHEPTEEEMEEEAWEECFARLEDYSQNNDGDANISIDGESGDKELFKWTTQLRLAFKKGTLRSDRVERLEAIGFDFDGVLNFPSNTRKWNKMYHALVEFKQEHGHTYVPFEFKPNPRLGRWVAAIKGSVSGTRKLEGNVCASRRARLEKLGFDFRVNYQYDRHNDLMFDKRLKELIEYKKANGGEDPTYSLKGLRQWCMKQRERYHDGVLPKDHLSQLKGAGFSFESTYNPQVKIFEDQWESNYKELKQLYLEHKTCNITASLAHPRLLEWVKRQRQKHIASKLSEDRFNLLKEINFPFNDTLSQEEWKALTLGQWNMMYSRVLSFYESNGHCNFGPDLAKWAIWMKDSYKLTHDRKQQLCQLIGEQSPKRCTYHGCKNFATPNNLMCRTHSSMFVSMQENLPHQFQDMFEKLVTYFQDTGYLNNLEEHDASLGMWLNMVRASDKLTTSQKQQLLLLEVSEKNKKCCVESCGKYALSYGSCWDHRTPEEQIMENSQNDSLDELSDGEAIYGALQPSAAEHTKKKASKLIVKKTQSCDVEWEANYRILKEFHRIFGGCTAPEVHNQPKLLRWIKKQMNLYNNNALSEDKVQKLRALNFPFEESIPKFIHLRKGWGVRYSEMISHYEKYGSCRVLKKHDNYSLLRWREKQMYKHKKGMLSDYRVEHLQRIDFWGSSLDEIKPACVHSDCSKFAVFDGYCHIHSISYGKPCSFACCKDPFRWEESCGIGGQNQVDIMEEENDDDNTNISKGLAGDIVVEGIVLGENEVVDAIEDKSESVQFETENDFHDCPSHDINDKAEHTEEQESELPWEMQYHALNAYIQQHGHPPQTRDDHPSLYDWLKVQKERQSQMEHIFKTS